MNGNKLDINKDSNEPIFSKSMVEVMASAFEEYILSADYSQDIGMEFSFVFSLKDGGFISFMEDSENGKGSEWKIEDAVVDTKAYKAVFCLGKEE